MKYDSRLLFTAGLALVFCPSAWSHDGDTFHTHGTASERTWTLRDTGETIRGQFVSSKDDRVWIRRNDGWVRPAEIRRLSMDDQAWIRTRMTSIHEINTTYVMTSQQGAQGTKNRSTASSEPGLSLLQKSFEPFKSTVKTRADADYFYVESNGVPDHQMMVGITAWQQQVPIPQKYTGSNAWQIPLHPVPAKEPMSAKDHFFRGAIAIAVNGIPIFNPIKNDGRTDTLIAGELDNWGGHCGRADDYHYHIAPTHLQKETGTDVPIAWALDGYPIYGYQDEKAPDFAPLDEWNGHKDADGHYHYHATKKYPYLNGGFFGEVVERDGQVDPQPRAESPRPALPPLQGAKIVDFETASPGNHVLTYEIRGRKGSISYSVAENGSAKFTFKTPNGETSIEEYTARPARGGRPGGEGGPPRDDRPESSRKGKGPPRDGDRPPKNGERPPRDTDRPPRETEDVSKGGRRPPRDEMQKNEPSSASRKSIGNMKLTSSSLDGNGMLSIDCTCDGKSESPAIAWSNVPKGTKSIAISLWHTAPDQEKSYWVVYNIPTSADGLKQNQKDIGTVGLNDRKKASFDPMCSRGPGVKTYHITVFALSEELKLSSQQATHKGLLEAVKGITLAETTLDFDYERQE
ncbi:MAG: YHYH protein [Planctomycetota bacterium]